MDPRESSKDKSLENSSKGWMLRLFSNTLFNGWMAIVGLIIGILGIVYSVLVTKEARPMYKVLSDIVLLDKSNNSRIKLYFDSVEVKNVRSVKIVFWNAGTGFLGRESFSENQPLTIYSPSPLKVLNYKLEAVTRSNLKFLLGKRERQGKGNSDCIVIKINGDEGFEAGDGGVINILYTSEKSSNWRVEARIKGFPDGFEEVFDGDRGDSLVGKIKVFFFVAIIFLTSDYAVERFKRKRRTALQMLLYIFKLFLIGLLIFTGYYYVDRYVSPRPPSFSTEASNYIGDIFK